MEVQYRVADLSDVPAMARIRVKYRGTNEMYSRIYEPPWFKF